MLFQQVSIASPVANAVAIPLISLVVVPLTLVGCIPPFGFLLYLANFIVDLCMHFLVGLSSSGAALWESHAPQPWAVVLALSGVVWLLLPRGFPARWLGLVAFVPLFAARPESLTTLPVSVPAVAPLLSELNAETDTPGAASAGEAARPINPTAISDAPTARTLPTSMSTPSVRARGPRPNGLEAFQSPNGKAMRSR